MLSFTLTHLLFHSDQNTLSELSKLLCTYIHLNFVTHYSSSCVYCICLYTLYNKNVNLRSQNTKAIILKPWQNVKLHSYTFTISFGLEHTFRVEQTSLYLYTGCPRRKGPNFGRVFLRSNYTDITQNTYIQSSMVTEILAREV